MSDSRLCSALYFSLLCLLIWLPLPFGSNTVWAMGLFQILVWLLAIGAVVAYGTGRLKITKSFHKGYPVLIVFLVVSGWQFFQSISLPASMVEGLSGKVFDIHQAAALAIGNSLPTTMTLSLDPATTRMHGFQTLAYAALFALILLLVSGTKKLTVFAWVLVGVGAFEAGYGLFSTLSGIEWSFFVEKTVGRGVATGTFVNRNSFAGHLEMTLALGVGLLVSQIKDIKTNNWYDFWHETLKTLMSSKVLLRVLLVVMVSAMVMTRSRMGNVAFFSSLMVAGAVYVITRKKLTRGVIILFVSLLIIDTAIVSRWFGLEKVVERLEQTQIETEMRADVNPASMAIIEDFAMTGTGSGSFYTTLPGYHDGTWRGFFDLAHNDYLQFPLELGIPVFVLLAGAVLWVISLAILTMKRRRSAIYIGMGFSAFMGLLAILIHSTVDFNLQIPANAAYFIVLMAVAIIARYDHAGKKSIVRSRQ